MIGEMLPEWTQLQYYGTSAFNMRLLHRIHILIFSTLVAGTSTDSVNFITLFAVASSTTNPARELSALRTAQAYILRM